MVIEKLMQIIKVRLGHPVETLLKAVSHMGRGSLFQKDGRATSNYYKDVGATSNHDKDVDNKINYLVSFICSNDFFTCLSHILQNPYRKFYILIWLIRYYFFNFFDETIVSQNFVFFSPSSKSIFLCNLENQFWDFRVFLQD